MERDSGEPEVCDSRAHEALDLQRGAAPGRRLCAEEIWGATDDVRNDELVRAAVKSLKRTNGNLVEATTAEIELKKGEVTK
eukprot:10473000-Heterocapsa_arctica.AAC.1